MRGSVQKIRQALRRGLDPLTKCGYDVVVARFDSKGDVRSPVQTVGAHHIERAYIEGNRFHARRIEEFRYPG